MLMVFAKDVNALVLSPRIELSESVLQRLHTLYESLSFCVSVFASLASLKPPLKLDLLIVGGYLESDAAQMIGDYFSSPNSPIATMQEGIQAVQWWQCCLIRHSWYVQFSDRGCG